MAAGIWLTACTYPIVVLVLPLLLVDHSRAFFLLIAEVFGARRMIYVKDEDGLYTADPKKDARAMHIPRISVQELLARDLDDLVVERAVLEMMLNARHMREIQFVNGLKPGQLTAALDGEPVGTIIFNDASGGAA